MSSIKNVNSKKYTVVLFQGGLGDHGEGFNYTIDLLKSKTTGVIKYNTTLQMHDYDVIKEEFYNYGKDGYLTKASNIVATITSQIAEIVNLSLNNPNKAILVKTSLDESVYSYDKNKKETKYLGFDSIENQSIKLIYLINKIKSLSNKIRLILVGHSQGGLVNLETACKVPGKIEKLLSISTPYSPVLMANKLICIATIVNIFGQNVYNFVAPSPELAPKYKDRVETLGSSNYFKELKDRWNNLSSRPDLIVIEGVSGHLFEMIINPDPTCGNTLMKKPFDGLVGVGEQTEIEHCTKHVLTDRNLPCYITGTFKDTTCYLQQGFYISCKAKCTLSNFDLTSTIIRTGLDLLWNLMTGDSNAFNLDSYPVIKDIFNGVNRQPIYDKNNQNYYNIYASDYSHMYIRYCDETLALLLSAFC